jgi:hypothetical protein
MIWTDRFQKKKYKCLINVWRCSTPLAIKEIEIKIPMRFYPTPVKMAIIKKTNENECWWACVCVLWGKETYTLLLGMWINTTTIEITMEFPQETKDRIILWSLELLGIYPKECMSPYFRVTHVHSSTIHSSWTTELP